MNHVEQRLLVNEHVTRAQPSGYLLLRVVVSGAEVWMTPTNLHYTYRYLIEHLSTGPQCKVTIASVNNYDETTVSALVSL